MYKENEQDQNLAPVRLDDYTLAELKTLLEFDGDTMNLIPDDLVDAVIDYQFNL